MQTAQLNPLSKFFPVEDREDGVYVNISPESRGTLHIQDIVAELEKAMVTNYDADRLVELLGKPSSSFEKAGPPFEYYDTDMEKYIDISVTPMKAGMTFSSTAGANDIKPTPARLAYFLRRKGIVFGIKHDAVRDIALNGLFDREVVVAEGMEPTVGQDARLVFEVDLEKDALAARRARRQG